MARIPNIAHDGSGWFELIMANQQIALPEQFDFDKPGQFQEWLIRFQHYLSISQTGSNNDKLKENTLIILFGCESWTIISVIWNDRDWFSKLQTVKERFRTYFVGKRNIIFEMAQFNMRIQLPGDKVENFVASLHAMARHLEFRNLKERLICNRVVIGISDHSLSEKLQMQSDLTLEKAISMCR